MQWDFAGGLHAVEHAMIAMAPLYALCDRWDIGGVSTPLHTDTEEPTIFIYDGFEGGIGIAETLYKIIDKLLNATLMLETTANAPKDVPHASTRLNVETKTNLSIKEPQN